MGQERQKLGHWAIVPPDGARGESVLVGRRRLPLADVCGVALGEVTESDIAGKLLVCALFTGLAGTLLLGVALGWQARVLIGAGVIGAIGLTAGVEAWMAGKSCYFGVDLSLRDGETVRFATPSQDIA